MAGWLLLLASLVGAALVWNAYFPTRSGPRRAFVSFFTGWLESELAIHHIAWQAVATAVFVAFGALASGPGQLGLAIALASWVALGVHYAGGIRAREAVERALVEGLGSDYRARMDPAHVQSLDDAIDWGPILRPFPIRHPDVEKIADLRFRRASAVDLELDVYRPRARPERAPVLFYVHGGGWVIGDKRQQGLPLVTHMASRGWLCVNVNYRLSPHATFPDHLIDLKDALRWVREEGPRYGADPDFVVTTGGSAGGHLAALLALTPNDPEYQPGFESADTSVQGCVPIYGVYDFVDAERLWPNTGLEGFLARHVMKATREEAPEAYAKASPLACVSPDAPPFMVVHGDVDTLVPVEQARRFAERLRAVARSPVVYLEVPGAQHAFELFPSLRSQLVRKGIERFLATLRFQHAKGRRASAA